MKKSFFSIIAIIMALLASCASQSVSSVTENLILETDVETAAPFDGLWELPNGQFKIIKENAFVLMSEDAVISAGIFTHTDTQIAFSTESELYAVFDYFFESGNLNVSGIGNEWAHGIWKKTAYSYSSKNKLAGYWECKSENEIRILHILPFGLGTWFTCDTSYELKEKSNIRYEENNYLEFRLILKGADFSISFPVKFQFDGADLIVEGNRYVRK